MNAERRHKWYERTLEGIGALLIVGILSWAGLTLIDHGEALAEAKVHHADTDKKVDGLREDLGNQVGKIDKNIDGIQKDIHSIQLTNQQLQSDVKNLTVQIGSLDTRIGGLDTRMDDLEAKVDDIGDKLDILLKREPAHKSTRET